MKKIVYSLLFLVVFASSSFAQLANWSTGNNAAYTNFPVNVSGQINGFCRISQMKFHASDPNKMYAVTGEGGFFSTSDGGANWTVRPGTENLTGGCASLCIDYTNDQVIYLGSGDANYYSNGQGIYKSTNGGTSFTATSLTNCLVIEILQDPSNPATFVAATNKGIYKSINNGSTWTSSTLTNIQFCDLVRNAATNSSTLYACTRENSSRFFRSTDFGSTWTQITSGITTAVNFIQAGGRIGVTPADPNVVYFEAIGGGGIVHKSIDGGLNFTVSKPEGTGTLAAPYITFYDYNNANTLTGQGNYNNAICVDATDPSKLWIQAHNTWLSTDNGVTWTEITHWSTKVHTDMHQLTQSPFNSSKLYSCNDGGVWLSTDGGNNWNPTSNGLYAYEIYNNCGKSSNTDRNYIALGTQDNGRVFRNAIGFFTDRGGDDTRQKEFDYLPNGGFYYEKTQLNRKSVSTGSTSSAGFTTSGNYWEYLAFNRSNTNLGFMWFTDNNLYRSTNLSNATPTWTSVFTFTAPVTAMHSCIADPTRLYVITNDAKIQVCSNALDVTPTFSTFNLPSASGTLASIAAIANDANKVYISINNKVYYSSNGGATWTDITYNLPNVNHRKVLAEEFGGSQELVFIATNNAVYYKKAGQVTWTNYSTNLPSRRAPTNFTMFDDGSNQAAIRFYTYGRGVWETPFSNLRAVNAQIAVTAEANPDCNTHTVSYGDASLGNIVSYAWTFAGGTPSTSNLPNPTVSYSSNGSYNVTLVVTDAESNTSSQTISKSVQLIPVIKPAVTINPNPPAATFCAGGAVNLTASGGASPSFVELGTGTTASVGNSSSSTLGPNPLQNWYGGSKQLMLFTQVELNNLGLTTGAQISSIAVNMPAAITAYVLQNLQVKVQNTTLTSLSAFVTSGWTVVRNPANYTLTGTGWNTIAFNSNYTWDGISNLLIEVNYSNNNGGSSGNTALYGATTNISTLLYRADNVSATAVDTYSGTPTYSYNFRNNVRFGLANISTTYNWSPTTGLNSSTGAIVAANPTATTTYTVSANSAGTCPVNSTQLVSLLNYPITASAGANGGITPSGTTNVDCGLNQVYSIVPNGGFVIQDVLVDGVSQGAISNYTFTNVTAAHTISATFTVGSNSIIASAGANGTITPSGTVSVALGGNQTFLISPNPCYQIADVLVDGVSQGAISSYTFTNVTAAHTISASFSQLTYGITASAGSNGSISPNGMTTVNCGANLTYTITPNSCYQILDVLVDGISQGAISSYTFTNVTAAHTISASFSQLTYGITASAGSNGSISPNGLTTVNCGANLTYTITPNSCYQILDVLVDGVSQGAISSYTFTNVAAAHTISASFSQLTYGITASAGSNGSISPNGLTTVNCGANLTYSIAPNSCYQILDVLVDGVSQGAISSYTFTNVTAAHTISASFSQLTYGITASAGSNGSISPNGLTTVNCGANQSYTIQANLGYTIQDVIVDGISQGAIATYTFTNVTASHTISAVFNSAALSITATAGANGSISPSGVQVVTSGSNLQFTIQANTCYQISEVLVDGISQGAISTYTFTNISTSHTITASFTPVTFAITASSGANGSVTPSGTSMVNCGSNTTYSITPNGGFAIQSVLVDGISQGSISSYTFTNVNTTHTISATFVSGIPATSLTPASCNSTVSSMYDQIYCTPVAGASNYRYKVENTTLGFNSVFERNSSLTDFRMNWAPGVQYATTYTVSVAAKVNGNWGAYGASCTVTIGPFPTTHLSPASCNSTLSGMSDPFTCVAVNGATDYQYRISNTALSYSVEVKRNSTLNDYRLSWLPAASGAQYATTYNVEVRAFVGGVWGNYGSICQLTTPPVPLTKLQPAYCANYALPSFSSVVNCVSIAGASNYRYHITGPASYNKTFTRNSPLNDWRFSWTLACCGQQNMLPNSTYIVEVAYYINGVWSAYGAPCTVVTGTSVPRFSYDALNPEVTVEAKEAGLRIYPNPVSISEPVMLEIHPGSDETTTIDIAIYSMIGERIFANKLQCNSSESCMVEPKMQFASGVYIAEAIIRGTPYRTRFVVK
ncbi:MAG TPA: PKD domain-containing protein [Bacteroidia bacterium]|nr:PKD domain-containing protein [Bacteroidia bacterium]HRH07311.1 PKD domain-containing protein [Bacteroidia bacterium]